MSDSVASFARRLNDRNTYDLASKMLERKRQLEEKIKMLENRVYLRQSRAKKKQILAQSMSDDLRRWIE